MKKFLIGLMDFFIHFFRRILFFLTSILLTLICQIIFLITFEPHTMGKVTIRKIRRIRRLTNVKLWIWKHFGWYFKFIHQDKYLIDLEKKLGK